MIQVGDGSSVEHAQFRSGFCAVVGRPNVGKSTLLNHIVGEKVTIVSDKPQTTRNKIQLIMTTSQSQVVFIDTPGMHSPRNKLGHRMMQMAEEALSDVDVILMVVDAAAGPGRGDQMVARRLRDIQTPSILALNKIDLLAPDELKQAIAAFEVLGDFPFIYPISAKTGEGVTPVVERVLSYLPPGPQYYPDDWVTDHPERFIIAELIREKVLHETREEIPYAVAVDIEKIEARAERELVDVSATVYVERASQRGIVIGRGGSRLKSVGTAARIDIERLLGSAVNLQLWVKVSPDWRDKERALRAFGYR